MLMETIHRLITQTHSSILGMLLKFILLHITDPTVAVSRSYHVSNANVANNLQPWTILK